MTELRTLGSRAAKVLLHLVTILFVAPMLPVSAAPASPPQVPSVEVLDTFGEESGSFEVAIDRCHAADPSNAHSLGDCPIRVRLLIDGKVADNVIVGAHACGTPTAGGDHRFLSFGTRTKYRSTSGPGCEVSVLTQPVSLAPEVTGALISQSQGAEHPTRKHWLFVERGGKLFLAWSSDQEGASDLVVDRVASPIGRFEDVVTTQIVEAKGDVAGLAERIVARRLHWNPLTGLVIPYPMPDEDFPLYLVYVGPFKTATAARHAGASGPSGCQLPSAILAGSLFPGLGLRSFVRGAVVVDRAEADDEVARMRAGNCPASLLPRAIQYMPKLEYSARTPH